MPDIKFRCPECAQKIAVEAAAAGFQIECPSCKSSLIIPPTAEAPVKTIQRREFAVLASATSVISDQISAKQKELDDAVAESKRLRAEAENFRQETEKARQENSRVKTEAEKATAELERLRIDLSLISSERDSLRQNTPKGTPADSEKAKQDLAALRKERDELETKLTAFTSLREQLVRAERELDNVRDEVVTSTKERDILGETSARMQKQLRSLADSAPKGGIQVKDVHALLEKMAAFDRERTDLKATLTEVYHGAGTKWDELEKQAENLRKQLVEITAERDALKLSSTKAVDEAAITAPLKAELQKASSQVLELNEQLTSLKRERDELRAKVTAADGLPNELAAAREEAAKVRSQYSELTRMLEAAKLDCDQANSLEPVMHIWRGGN